MTLFGILWVAHLPSMLGVMPPPAPVVLLDPGADLFTPASQAGTAPMAMASPAPSEAMEPMAATPLQSLASHPLKNLGASVDWQRWQHTAAVTVVATTVTEDTPADPLQPHDLALNACPAAYPKYSEAEQTPVALATTSDAASPEEPSPEEPSPEESSPEESSPEESSPEETSFVIQVKGVAIGQVASAEVAEQVAMDLRQAMPVLAQSPQDLAPTMEGSRGVGELQDHAIFSLSPAALGEDESVALTTAQWVNNLRLALGAQPLNPGQVQRVAYGLDPTSTQFQGIASWYGPYFHGRQTATGEIFDQDALTAAHKTLPFDTYLEVRNLLNGKTVVVRINDRGPYVGERSLDLSYAAARCLGSVQVGIIPYEATILTPGDPQAWEEAALPL